MRKVTSPITVTVDHHIFGRDTTPIEIAKKT